MGEMIERKKMGKVSVVKLLFAVMLGMILIPSLILTVQPAGMESQTAEVSIQGATVAQGETVEVPINITNVTDLAATTIWLSYDSSVVTVEEVREGTLGDLYVGINNTAGVTKMSWFSATGKTGDFVFAYVTLKAVGRLGETSILDLEVKKMVNSKNEPINYTVRDGIFNISEAPKVHDINITTDYKGACNGIKITRDGTDVVGCEENLIIGEVYKIRYKLVNEGDFDETVNMTITVYNETFSETIGTPTHSLEAGDSDTYDVEWDTEGLAPGEYTIKVEASIPDDADPEDNIRTRDVILVFTDTEGPEIAFIEPTPPDGANLTVNYVNVTVKVTDKSGVCTVLLNWNGENETMNAIAPEIYSVNKTGLTAGTYTFKVYANDTLNNWNVSETRSVIVSVPQKKIGDMNGDGEVTFDDVIALAKHIYFGDPVHDDPDVNGDDAVTFDDVILLAKHIYFETPIYP